VVVTGGVEKEAEKGGNLLVVESRVGKMAGMVERGEEKMDMAATPVTMVGDKVVAENMAWVDPQVEGRVAVERHCNWCSRMLLHGLPAQTKTQISG
jgi:hypothetical protein